MCLLTLSKCFMCTARVVFTKLPSLTASLSTPNSVAITCSTKSTPIAEITWFFVQNSGITTQLINSSETLITSEQVGGGVMSTLQISPIEDLSIAGLFCRGNNGFLQSESKVLDTSRSKHYIHVYTLCLLILN